LLKTASFVNILKIYYRVNKKRWKILFLYFGE
jgi:hypothetical protein